MASHAHETNPLAPEAVAAGASEALVFATKGSNEDSDAARSPSDLIVALLHAALVALGFRCVGLGEPNTPGSCTFADTPQADALPPAWNAAGDAYSLCYRHHQSACTFLVKSVRLANKLVVHAMAIEDDRIHDWQLAIDSIVSPSATFPIKSTALHPQQSATLTATPNESATSSNDLPPWPTGPLASALTSRERLVEVITQFKIHIVQKLIPGLNKPGYEESRVSTATESNTASSSSSSQPHPASSSGVRLPPPPMHPFHPGHRSPHGGIGIGGGGVMGVPFYGSGIMGNPDLDPLAGSPGLVIPPRFGGVGGGGPMGGNGMFIGPTDPIFGGMGHRGGPFAPSHPGAGPMRLPPGAVPPGARFDPIVPFGPQSSGGPFAPTAQPTGPTRGGVQPNHPFSGDPDNDHLPPPGMYM